MKNYLKVIETKNKAAKFLYQVINENGTIINERRSNKEYVACTFTGGYFFGRLDLIGKGKHGQAIAWEKKMSLLNKYPFRNTYDNLTEEESLERLKKSCLETLDRLNTILYLNK